MSTLLQGLVISGCGPVMSKRVWPLHKPCTDIQVAIVAGFHLFPFRTEKLSPFTPMVLRKWESRSPPSFRTLWTTSLGRPSFLSLAESAEIADYSLRVHYILYNAPDGYFCVFCVFCESFFYHIIIFSVFCYFDLLSLRIK